MEVNVHTPHPSAFPQGRGSSAPVGPNITVDVLKKRKIIPLLGFEPWFIRPID